MASEVEAWRNARFEDDETSDSGLHPTDQDEVLRDKRTHSQRDRDRILYTSALRRLASVTQVVSPTAAGSTHNRLTHALKVAQVGRRIAENLVSKNSELSPEKATDPTLAVDPEVVEAAGLAHDLGHPPFGHAAEKELDKLAKANGCEEGFEGNAQSFRIVTRLEVRGNSLSQGLGLTRATLNALLKYPWGWPDRDPKKGKFGVFHEDREVFDWCRKDARNEQTLEAQIMDWADDITYASHDLEDFYRSNLIPVAMLQNSAQERDTVIDKMIQSGKIEESHRQTYSTALKGIVDNMPPGPYRASLVQRKNMRAFVSLLVNGWVNTTGFINGKIARSPKTEIQVSLVKQLTVQYVIEGSTLGALQQYQVSLVSRVFELLTKEATGDGNPTLIPPNFSELMQEASGQVEKTRVLIDLLATMSEEQVLNIHRRASEVDWTLA